MKYICNIRNGCCLYDTMRSVIAIKKIVWFGPCLLEKCLVRAKGSILLYRVDPS